ncbi:MAG: hypothetical protein NT010_06700 [Proteobacteria bacterium]|nr:hypothetical protein [Pseudomonadota bacterium]
MEEKQNTDTMPEKLPGDRENQCKKPAVLVICRNLSYSLPPILPIFQEDSSPEYPVSGFFTKYDSFGDF